MIILDPDLEPESPHGRRPVRGGPGPSPQATAAKHLASSVPAVLPKSHRLPSARTLTRFLAEAQAVVRLKGEVSVLLTTDANIRRLNRQFRGKNKATDVLSFPADPIPGLKAEGAQAGDLAISVPTALKQAIEQGHPLSIEIEVLILHGLLHLAGYDHEADAGQMARRERLLRAKLGLPQGLIERAEAPKPVNRKPATKAASKPPVLKGHGLSRAAQASKKNAASAAAKPPRRVGTRIAQGESPGEMPSLMAIAPRRGAVKSPDPSSNRSARP
jgi:probable rRNA maturation factor